MSNSSVGIPTDQFKQMLREHDWSYNYSDDPRVYRRGQAQWDAIQSMLRSYPELKPVFDACAGRSWR